MRPTRTFQVTGLTVRPMIPSPYTIRPNFFPSRHSDRQATLFVWGPLHLHSRVQNPTIRVTMPRLAAAAAVSRRAGEALRRGALGGLRPLSSLQPSNAASSDEVTKRLVRRRGILFRHRRRGVRSLTRILGRCSWKERQLRAPPCSTAPATLTRSPPPWFVLISSRTIVGSWWWAVLFRWWLEDYYFDDMLCGGGVWAHWTVGVLFNEISRWSCSIAVWPVMFALFLRVPAIICWACVYNVMPTVIYACWGWAPCCWGLVNYPFLQQRWSSCGLISSLSCNANDLDPFLQCKWFLQRRLSLFLCW